MKNKNYTFLALLLALTMAGNADPVDIRTAREVGAKFVSANAKTPLRGVDDLHLVSTYSIDRGEAAFYIFNTPNGFVIVSADDCATPILGYSDEGRPFDVDNIPIQLQGYLKVFVEQIQFGIENHLEADERIAGQWERVRSTGRLNVNRDGSAVEPLVTAMWGQGCFYNAMCPEDENGQCGRVPTGCVATAMGMIMHYWGYPTHGNGSHTYTPYGYPAQTAHFAETTYNWSEMPDQLNEFSTQTEIEAISTLLWHCGISLDMKYDLSGSGAYLQDLRTALNNFFNYNCNQVEELGVNQYVTINQWFTKIKSNLDDGMPIIYSGYTTDYLGHSWVCDGYDSDSLLHFNWGWGGVENGYFAIGASNVLNWEFNVANQTIFDIHPQCDANSVIHIIANVNNPDAGYVVGGGNYSCEQECTLTAIANEGYHFVKWTESTYIPSYYGGLDYVISIENNYSFFTTCNREITAVFAKDEDGCNLVFDIYDSGGDGMNGCNLQLNYGDGSWENLSFGCGSFDSFTREFLDESHVEIWVSTFGGNYWTEISYDIAFENGAFIYQQPPLNEYLTNNHYEFDLNCEVQYAPRAITVDVNPENSGIVNGDGVYNPGDICTLSAIPSVGHRFAFWEENGEITSADSIMSFVVGITDRHFTAHFGPYQIALSSNLDEGGIVIGGGTFNYGDTCTITAVANEGYVFMYWTKDGNVISCSDENSIRVTDNMDLVAVFAEEDTVCIITISFEGFNWAGHVMTIEYGDGFTENIAPDEWTYWPTYTRYIYDNTHIILSWTNGGVTWGNSFDVYSWNNSLMYHGNWNDNSQFDIDYHCEDSVDSYNITLETNNMICGTVIGSGIYDYGSTATLSATANEGFVFINWTKNGEEISEDATFDLLVMETGNYVANFGCEIQSTVNPMDGGSVVGSGVYSYGTMATLTAISNPTYGFTYWTKDGCVVSNDPEYCFIVTESATYEASFMQYYNYITVTADPENGGIVSGMGYYLHETTAILTATANDGYTFLNWTLDGDIVSTEATYSFTVTQDATFVANFEETNIVQTTSFVQGWNWWSGYVELGDDGLSLMQEGLDTHGLMIKSQNDGYVSYTEEIGWYGSLEELHNEQSYRMKANTACTVQLQGLPTNPANYPITLNPGWTWMGFPWSQSVSVESALEGFEPEANDLIKGRNAYTMYYAEDDYSMWFGPLNSLEPGQGYVYYSNSGEAKTLTHQTNGGRSALPNVTADDNLFRPEAGAYPDNMSVMAVVELDGEELQGEQYELAAFANGEVRGSARLLYVEPLDRYVAFLTVAGDEAAELYFRLYNNETSTVVETVYSPSLQYETNAVIGSFEAPYVVSFRGMTGMEEWGSGISLYPNPAKNTICISGLRTNSEVLIFNAIGELVKTATVSSDNEIGIGDLANGLYLVRCGNVSLRFVKE